VVLWDNERKELSEYLGIGTNNIAELTAVDRGLDIAEAAAPARDRPVRVYTDSAYSIGVLSMGWKAKANQELVARIRAHIAQFPDVTFVKVAGHAGVPENERCDELARLAVETRGRR
jgi:ribonuclease HI